MSRLKITAAVVVGLGLLVGGGVGIVELDKYADRDRAMYHDTIVMAEIQWDLLRSGKKGVEIEVDSSTAVLVGHEPFQAHEGVSVVVEERDGAYCVQGHNQYGNETQWECVDGTGPRPELGALEGENF